MAMPLDALDTISNVRPGSPRDRQQSMRDDPGTLHMTVSLVIPEMLIRQALGKEHEHLWSAEKRRRFGHPYSDSRRLGQAIEPLFDDIADRERGLFTKDFLLDTPSTGTVAHAAHRNLCDVLQIVAPPNIEWATEGERFRITFAEPARLQAYTSAFWVAHRNGMLSYHMSFEIEYEHRPQHYYCLSLLQKAVTSTEGTEWVNGYDTDRRLDLRTTSDPGSFGLRDYVLDRFAKHAVHLLRQLKSGAPGSPHAGLRDPPGNHVELLLEHANSLFTGNQCRSVFLLKDRYFFDLLAHRNPEALRELTQFLATIHSQSTMEDNRKGGPVIAEYDERIFLPGTDGADACGRQEADLDRYFLAGFLQNVIDFLRQDASEVADGTDPVYPPADHPAPADEHFLVYTTKNAMYEITPHSRSLEVGRKWIGTCPYLFLVHMMSMHNEILVKRYEAEVIRLVEAVDRMISPDQFRQHGSFRVAVGANEAFECFRLFRLTVFNEVYKHLYSNVLRYDTERAFYDSVESARGTQQRRSYWEDVVDRLEKTIDDIRGHESEKSNRRLNTILYFLAAFGVVQILFDLYGFAREDKWGELIGLGSLVVVVATVATLFYRWIVRRGSPGMPKQADKHPGSDDHGVFR